MQRSALIKGAFTMKSGRILAILIASTICWIAGYTAVSAQSMRVHFIDVGQGDATLIEFPCAAVLVDTGGENNAQFNSDEALLHYLSEFFARRTDPVSYTHLTLPTN